MLIYDCEIINAIPPRKGEERIPGIKYCAGWNDYENMGISVIAVFDYLQWEYRVFCQDNFDQFQALMDESGLLIGFNNLAFDNNLLRAAGFRVEDKKCVDLLPIIWEAAGLKPPYDPKTHAGFGLEAICQYNFQQGKSGRGDLAPVMWQQGRIGLVIDYALRDIKLTKLLYDHLNLSGWIKDPRNGQYLQIEPRKLKINELRSTRSGKMG